MEKELPPSYTEATTTNIGFNIPKNTATHPPQAFQGHIPNQQIYPGQQVHIQPGAPVVVANVPLVIQGFGPHPQPVTCPSCHHQTTTKIVNEPSTKTHLLALILCFFGCIPCCLLPYCIDSCQNQNHYCSNCSAYLGVYNDSVPYTRRDYW